VTPPDRPGPGPGWQERVTAALSSISEAVCFLDEHDRVAWVNAAAERLLERRGEDLVGQAVWREYPQLVDSSLHEALHTARRTGEPQHLEYFSAALDRWLEFRVFPHRDGTGVFFRDVHERRTLDDERAAESRLVRGVLDALPARTAILDPDGTILTVNASWAAGSVPGGHLLGTGPGDDYLAACRAAAGNRDAQALADGVAAVLAGEAPSFSLDYAWTAAGSRPGRETWWHVQVFPVDAGPRAVVAHTDVTDRVTAEQRAAWQARHDHLTDLPNRVALHEVIGEALAEDDGAGRVTLLYMDVDGFKQVNDTLGHSAGDLLLREMAARLAHRTRPTDVVGRLGGDEFVVVARECDADGAEALARRFRAVFDEPFELAGSRLPVTVSVGVATSGAGHDRPDDLLRDADLAMYAAKAGGPNRHAVFTPELRSAENDRRAAALRLRSALDGGELELYWQPLVRLGTRQVTGCEALLRWQHPERGLVLPADFIPVAEEDGSIVPVTRWLLRAAAEQAVAWSDLGWNLTASVNVSPVHLAAGTLVDDVQAALDGSGLAAHQLVVEVTETTLVRNTGSAAEQLADLRELGVRIAIDDFGTGYSSLSAVAALPADVLKVDRTLVAVLSPVSVSAAEAVLTAAAALGTALDMQVVAEGVETPEQLDLVRRAGCGFVQGYLFSRPQPADRMQRLLASGLGEVGGRWFPV
jgi:diguanylate cyclase (GGDEF)-like protein